MLTHRIVAFRCLPEVTPTPLLFMRLSNLEFRRHRLLIAFREGTWTSTVLALLPRFRL